MYSNKEDIDSLHELLHNVENTVFFLHFVHYKILRDMPLYECKPDFDSFIFFSKYSRYIRSRYIVIIFKNLFFMFHAYVYI